MLLILYFFYFSLFAASFYVYSLHQWRQSSCHCGLCGFMCPFHIVCTLSALGIDYRRSITVCCTKADIVLLAQAIVTVEFYLLFLELFFRPSLFCTDVRPSCFYHQDFVKWSQPKRKRMLQGYMLVVLPGFLSIETQFKCVQIRCVGILFCSKTKSCVFEREKE